MLLVTTQYAVSSVSIIGGIRWLQRAWRTHLGELDMDGRGWKTPDRAGAAGMACPSDGLWGSRGSRSSGDVLLTGALSWAWIEDGALVTTECDML
jgi:hypothetical protein